MIREYIKDSKEFKSLAVSRTHWTVRKEQATLRDPKLGIVDSGEYHLILTVSAISKEGHVLVYEVYYGHHYPQDEEYLTTYRDMEHDAKQLFPDSTEGAWLNVIKISEYQRKEKLGLTNILGDERFTYKKEETYIDEYALCYGINGSEFLVTISDLRQYLGCTKCGRGADLSSWRVLFLKYSTIQEAEKAYVAIDNILSRIRKAGDLSKKKVVK